MSEILELSEPEVLINPAPITREGRAIYYLYYSNATLQSVRGHMFFFKI